MNISREPAAIVGIVVAILVALLPVFNFSPEAAASVAGALTLIGGAIVAGMVSVDKLLPLLVGLGQAVVGVAVAFNIDIPANYVTAGMAVLSVIAGLAVTRPQVAAKTPPVATLTSIPRVEQTYDR